MRRTVFLVFIVVAGCAALAAVPSVWTPRNTLTESLPVMKEMPFLEVPTKLHGVIVKRRGTLTQFMLQPNPYQVCACSVVGESVDCACYMPEIGLCPEFGL